MYYFCRLFVPVKIPHGVVGIGLNCARRERGLRDPAKRVAVVLDNPVAKDALYLGRVYFCLGGATMPKLVKAVYRYSCTSRDAVNPMTDRQTG